MLKIEIPAQLAVIALDLHMPNPQPVAWDAPCVRGMEGGDSQGLKYSRCLGVLPTDLSVCALVFRAGQ